MGLVGARVQILKLNPGLPIDTQLRDLLSDAHFETLLRLRSREPAVATEVLHFTEYHWAKARLAQINVELRRRELTGETAPRALAELGLESEITTDPFTGQEFAYRAGPDRIVLHSVGPDASDQGQALIYDWARGAESEGDIPGR